jgi:hypothetical protein
MKEGSKSLLTKVANFQGTMLLLHFWPHISYSLDEDKIQSLLYTLVIPMLSTLIYSTWNKNVESRNKK